MMTKENRLAWVMLSASAAWCVADPAGVAMAQSRQSRAPTEDPLRLEVLPVRGNVYLLHGAGANVTLSVGRDGVLLVDTGTAAAAARVVTTVRALATQVLASPVPAKLCVGLACDGGPAFPSYHATTGSPPPAPPIRYVIDTSADPDHTGGNAIVGQSGTTVGGGPGVRQFQAVLAGSATIYAHERVLRRLSDADAPAAAWPTETFTDRFGLYFNGEGVQLIHIDAGHSNGDLIVHFRGSDVISTGDVFSIESYPKIDLEHGGSINGSLDALNRLLDLAIPEYQTEGGTLLIPGHGRICDAADLASYRDGMTIIRDRVKTLMGRKMTLDQIKAAKPTKDYDTRYATRELTGEAFVEAIYRSLTAPGRPTAE